MRSSGSAFAGQAWKIQFKKPQMKGRERKGSNYCHLIWIVWLLRKYAKEKQVESGHYLYDYKINSMKTANSYD